MGFLDTAINLNDLPVSEERDFSPIPAGDYVVSIVKAEIKETKAGTGQYISIRMDVAEGKYAKRVLWSNINFRNPSEAAENIGRAQLGEIMRAGGIAQLAETDQLIGVRLSVRVAVGEYNGNPNNEVKSYRAADNAPSVVAGATSGAGASEKKATPPWGKK